MAHGPVLGHGLGAWAASVVRQLNCLGSDDSGHTIFDRGVKYDDGFREVRDILNKSCSRSRTSDSGHTILERSPMFRVELCQCASVSDS